MLFKAPYLDIEDNLFYFKAKYEEIFNKGPTDRVKYHWKTSMPILPVEIINASRNSLKMRIAS